MGISLGPSLYIQQDRLSAADLFNVNWSEVEKHQTEINAIDCGLAYRDEHINRIFKKCVSTEFSSLLLFILDQNYRITIAANGKDYALWIDSEEDPTLQKTYIKASCIFNALFNAYMFICKPNLENSLTFGKSHKISAIQSIAREAFYITRLDWVIGAAGVKLILSKCKSQESGYKIKFICDQAERRCQIKINFKEFIA